MSTEWYDTAETIAKRWPKWKRTETDYEDWKRALGHLNQEWVREACFRVKNYSSETPQLKWVLHHFHLVEKEQAVFGQAQRDEHESRLPDLPDMRETISTFPEPQREWVGHYAWAAGGCSSLGVPRPDEDVYSWTDEVVIKAYLTLRAFALVNAAGSRMETADAVSDSHDAE